MCGSNAKYNEEVEFEKDKVVSWSFSNCNIHRRLVILGIEREGRGSVRGGNCNKRRHSCRSEA